MIKANGVTVKFKNGFLKKPIKALDNFSISVEKGDIFGLLGPNGAGKSTAMYCLLGLIKPDHGDITIFGERPDPGSGIFDKIYYLPEEPNYHDYLNVEEIIAYYISLYKRKIPGSRISEVIEKVGLSDFKDLRISKCSKGMKQKVGIAACLLSDAEIIFLDEPTRGLDPIIVKEFRDDLLRMNRNGATIIINSHMLSEMELVCNRVGIMEKGSVVIQDELKKMIKYDPDKYTVEFDVVERLPDYITEVSRDANIIKGELPVNKISCFFEFVSQNNIKIFECSLKKSTLENAFYDIVKGGKKYA